MKKKDSISSAITTFETLTKKPETFLSIQNEVTDNITTLIKSLYDFTKTEENKTDRSAALPQLIIKNFDEEQIWQELELQNESVWSELVDTVSKSMCNKEKLNFPIYIEGNEQENENEEDEVQSEEEEVETHKPSLKHKLNTKKIKKNSRKRTSIVDDEFFKLKDMENFLDIEDKKVDRSEKKKSSNLNDEESDDDSINLFEDIDSVGSDSQDEGANDAQVKYKDFFGDDGEEQNDGDKDDTEEDSLADDDDDKQNDSADDANNKYLEKMKKKVRFHMDGDGDGDASDSGKDNNSVDENKESSVPSKPEEPLSEYELRQLRLKKRIEKLESKNLGEKSWQMKGEIDASRRPQNSLLEEVVDFDLTTRPAPLITEETTFKLEDIIKQRIKDKVWDDVERKAKPTEEPQEFKKKLILDQEKSKLSLAQVYEREYIKQRNLLNPDLDEVDDEPVEHKNIKHLMATLFGKLDALSNYHYTPKTAIPEVKIISNIPAINLEEVAPVSTSAAALLAPEEVKAKKMSELMSKAERTTTDKKRERRKKKIHQKLKQKQKEAKSNSGSKLENKSKSLEKLIKDANVDKMVKLDDKSVKSSKSFFTQLQDVTYSKKNKPNKNNRVMLPAKKYKL